MNKVLDLVSENLGEIALSILAALAVLIGGWLVAFLLANIVRKILVRVQIDNKLSGIMGPGQPKFQTANFISKLIYYIILIFALIAFLKILGLSIITEPLSIVLNQTFSFLPRLIAAVILLFVAWIIASTLRFIIFRVLSASNFDQNIATKTGIADKKAIPISQTVAKVVYWLVFLLFLPTILNALNLESVLDPFTNMLSKLLGFIPNLFGAAIILIFGWLLAKIVRQVLESVLISIGTDQLAQKVGLDKFIAHRGLSSLIATIVYALILIPILIAGLNALEIKTISEPATSMLGLILNAMPAIFAAVIILAITFVIARLVSHLIINILTGAGFNNIFQTLGLSPKPISDAHKNTPAKVVGQIVIIALMLFATIEASYLLQFDALAELIEKFLRFAGRLALGIIIFALGLYLSKIAYKFISAISSNSAKVLAQVARFSIIILAIAMGLGEMNIAQNIVNLTFALSFGALAVAFALSVGLGTREIAAREVDNLIKKLKNKN